MIDTESGSVPRDWDRLAEREEAPPPPPAVGALPPSPSSSPPVLSVVASGWGDALAILAVCTAAVAAVHVSGYHYSLQTALWAAAASICWWVLASTALLAIRLGTPGMLMAGVVLAGPVRSNRIPWVLAGAAFSALCLGLPGLFGARRHPISAAARSPLILSGLSQAGSSSRTTRGA